MRHGETEWNLAGRAQGHLNSPLTQTGRQQAQRLGEILARELGSPDGFDQMASPIGRVQETVANIRQHFDLRPVATDLLKEIDLGQLSGLTKPEMVERFPAHMAGKPDHDWYFGAPGGETLADLRERASRWLGTLSRPTIAVAHGQIGKVIRGLCLGLDDAQILRLKEPQGVVHVIEDGAEEIWT